MNDMSLIILYSDKDHKEYKTSQEYWNSGIKDKWGTHHWPAIR